MRIFKNLLKKWHPMSKFDKNLNFKPKSCYLFNYNVTIISSIRFNNTFQNQLVKNGKNSF